MSDLTPPTQAALFYREAPALDIDRLLPRLNHQLERKGFEQVTPAMRPSPDFALLASAQMHVSVAIHRGAPDRQGLARALAAERQRSQRSDLFRHIDESRARVVICVGSGPSPVGFDPVAPVALIDRLAVLIDVLHLVQLKAPSEAIHLAACDRIFAPSDLARLSADRMPALLVHPEILRDAPPAETSTLVLHQSAHVAGATLAIGHIPARVPPDMALSLAEKILAQHAKGVLPLADGDVLSGKMDMALVVRRGQDDDGRPVISVSFAPDAGGALPPVPDFAPHPGYTAIRRDLVPDGADKGHDDAWGQDWGATGAFRSAPPPAASGGLNSTWMLMIGAAVLLWVVLPLLEIPQSVIHATFSDGLVLPAEK